MTVPSPYSPNPMWWRAQAWNPATIDFVSSIGWLSDDGYNPDDYLTGYMYAAAEGEQVVPDGLSLIPSQEFLTNLHFRVGTPAFAPEPGGEDIIYLRNRLPLEATPFQQWLFYFKGYKAHDYSNLRDGKWREDVLPQTEARRRADLYLGANEWTHEEVLAILKEVIAGVKVTEFEDDFRRFVEVSSFHGASSWMALLLNPVLPRLPKMSGCDQNLFEFMVSTMLNSSARKTVKANALRGAVNNPNVSKEVLEEIAPHEGWGLAYALRSKGLSPSPEGKLLKSVHTHPVMTGEATSRVHEPRPHVQEMIRAKMRETPGRFSGDMDYDCLEHGTYLLNRQETEQEAKEYIAQAFRIRHWEALRSILPLVGTVLSEKEEELGIEPGTIPVEWLIETF